MFSLVSHPVFAAINRDKTIYTISKSNVEPGIKQVKQEGILERFGFKRKNRIKQKGQGFFSKFNLRRQTPSKPKVQQKLHRQGFLSRFKLRSKRNQLPKKQKRGFLQRFGIGKT